MVGGGQTATQDNKHNLARREQYYATLRKLPPSPATLECIPGEFQIHSVQSSARYLETE